MNTVSVVIPTYNRHDTLAKAVTSALAQTHPVHEVLVCDDGSADRSRQVVDAIGNARVRWIDCGRNGMPSIPRNKGIAASTGQWIAFLDSDDEWMPTKIEKQLAAMQQYKVQASSTQAFRICDGVLKGTYLGQVPQLLGFAELCEVNYNICSSVVVSRCVLDEISYFPEEPQYKGVEDYALWLRIAQRERFVYLAEPLVNYLDQPTQSIRSENTKDEWAIQQMIFDGVQQWIRENEIVLTTDQKKTLKHKRHLLKTRGKLNLWGRALRKLKG